MDIRSHHLSLFLIAMILVASLVFVVDLVTPLGWVVWLPYIGLVFFASRLQDRTSTLILSGICTAFIILGLWVDYLYIDPGGTSIGAGIFNRLMGVTVLWGIAALVMRQQRIEGAREDVVRGMQESLANLKTLRGMLPFCLSCKKIREGNGYWSGIETFVTKHSMAEFRHELCPECEQYLQAQLPREPSIVTCPRELLSSPHRD